jgi:hypothetical protein
MERRLNIDSSAIIPYKIGKIYYYPETRITDFTDSLPFSKNFKLFGRLSGEGKKLPLSTDPPIIINFPFGALMVDILNYKTIFILL